MKKKLQVFVSSTFEDLKAERQAAVGAILKASLCLLNAKYNFVESTIHIY